MKKIITLTALITIVFSSLQVNAQPPWARAYGHQKHEDRRDYRDDRRGNWDDRQEDYRDNRRGNYRDERQVYRAPQRSSYYYYPRANVYYNPYAHNYSYLNNGAWISVNTLPREIYLDQEYQEVYCNDGENVWANNRSNVDYYQPAPRPIYVQPARPRVQVGVNLGVRF
ncbi:MAG: hypothetical protein H7068_09700 [Pedobacter sp.]|nr:hypothetical protein [Chitinophagaceae bacterium]